MLDKVLKAWDCCDPFNRRCFECPYEDDCFHDGFDRVAIADMVKLLKEQQAEIDRLKAQLDQYHKADGFLAVHGWQWKKTTTESSTNPKDGEQE